MTIFCGIDWAERHHDVALVDDTGSLLAKARITDDAAGYNKLMELLAEHGDGPDTPIPVAIETSHGLLVATLRAGKRKVFAINPLAASRYRDRHGVSRKKSIFKKLGLNPQQVRIDRILHEAHATADPIHLMRLFGISGATAMKYVRAAHPERTATLPR